MKIRILCSLFLLGATPSVFAMHDAEKANNENIANFGALYCALNKKQYRDKQLAITVQSEVEKKHTKEEQEPAQIIDAYIGDEWSQKTIINDGNSYNGLEVMENGLVLAGRWNSRPDNIIVCVDPQTRVVKQMFKGHKDSVWDIKRHSKSSFVSVSGDGRVGLHDLESAKSIYTQGTPKLDWNRASFYAVQVLPNGRIAAAGYSGGIQIFDSTKLEERPLIIAPQREGYGSVYSSLAVGVDSTDNFYLAVGDWNGGIATIPITDFAKAAEQLTKIDDHEIGMKKKQQSVTPFAQYYGWKEKNDEEAQKKQKDLIKQNNDIFKTIIENDKKQTVRALMTHGKNLFSSSNGRLNVHDIASKSSKIIDTTEGDWRDVEVDTIIRLKDGCIATGGSEGLKVYNAKTYTLEYHVRGACIDKMRELPDGSVVFTNVSGVHILPTKKSDESKFSTAVFLKEFLAKQKDVNE